MSRRYPPRGLPAAITVLLATATLLGGCLRSATTSCGDLVCPEGTVCEPLHNICVLPDQQTVCAGLADGAPCAVNNVSGFHCDQGICIPGRCGDGVVDDGEACDNGDGNSDLLPDGCRTSCNLPSCGDAVRDTGELCDNGAANDDQASDACRTNCELPRCGDGVVDRAREEVCDDGNNISGDGCSADCTSAESCGNGTTDVSAGEACDCGDATPLPAGCSDINGGPGGNCTTTCTLNYCGNGVVQAGEECDDGNNDRGDGCGPTCLREECGNEFVDPGEQCDSGAANSDTAPNRCRTDCTLPRCGDTVLDTGEQCDDGNTLPADDCSPTCQLERCGNQVIDPGEQCDDGAANSDSAADACRTTCERAHCGDGVVDTGEQCDDGGNAGGDGCSPTCVREECGNRIIDVGEQCDDATANSDVQADACRTSCRLPGCGDGVIDTGEYCDDGDALGGPCSANCQDLCGDDTRSGAEECDGPDIGGNTCIGQGFYSGTPGCTADCKIDDSPCSGYCTDGIKNGPEVCDGNDVGDNTCQLFGWYDGQTVCDPGCGDIDTSGCSDYCGDGTINGDELCDGRATGGQDCGSVFGTGQLGCNAFCIPDYQRCHMSRWSPVVLPIAQGRQGVGGTGPDDVWFVGNAAFHYDGNNYTQYNNIDGTMRAVYAYAPGKAWISGDWGYVYHHDGTNWSGQRINAPTYNSDRFLGIWGASPTDLWIVTQAGKIIRGDGTTWTEVYSGVGLHDVWGAAADDVYFAGNAATLVHWDGGGFTTTTLGANNLLGIDGTSKDDIWVSDRDGYVHHWDGAQWNSMPVAGVELRDIWAWSPNHVWAVGQAGETYRYDSGTWTLLQTSETGAFAGVWGSGPADVYVVGPSVWHYDGAGLVPAGQLPATIHALWASSSTDVWAVGDGGMIQRFDGTAWSDASHPSVTGQLRGIWGTSASDVWIVGANVALRWNGTSYDTPIAMPANTQGVWGDAPGNYWLTTTNSVYRWQGAGWNLDTEATDLITNHANDVTPIRGVWGSSASDVWITGRLTWMMHYDGTSWSAEELWPGVWYQFTPLWGTGPDNVYTTGSQGITWQYDTTGSFNGWGERFTFGSGTEGYDVHGSGPHDVWVVGSAGNIRRYDGVAWTSLNTASSDVWRAVWAVSPDDVWIGGDNGDLLHLSHQYPQLYGGTCLDPLPLTCQGTVKGSTSGGPSVFGSYGCGATSTPGAEVYYKIHNPMTGLLTLTLTPRLTHDLDLVVVGTDGVGGCDTTGACIAASHTVGGGATETLTFEGLKGETYYIIVDSPGGDAGAYQLTLDCHKGVACSPSGVEDAADCSDGIDNDCDGLIDGADPDCP